MASVPTINPANQITIHTTSVFLRSANKQEIIKAYRKLAQQWHPDNFQSETEKKEAEKKFIDIASAKEVLTDPGQALGWLMVIYGIKWIVVMLKVTFDPPFLPLQK